jgi:hypothetical protein
MRSVLACLFLLAAGLAGAQGPGIPWQAGITRFHMSRADEVMLVRPLSQWIQSIRPIEYVTPLDRRSEVPVFTARFAVVDSLGVRMPEVRVSATDRHVSPPPLDPSKTYLLVGRRPARGSVEIDSASAFGMWSLIIPSEPEDELFALLLLQTPAPKLRRFDDQADLITAAILDTIVPSSDDSYRTAARLLAAAHTELKERSSKIERGVVTPYSEEGVHTRLVREKLGEASDYGRSRLWELLLRWRVPGSYEPYVRSLEKLLTIPGAYTHPDDVQGQWGLIIRAGEVGLPLDGWFNYEFEELMSLRESAKSIPLLLVWLHNFGSVMDQNQIRRYARLLNHPHPAVRYRVATILASQLQQPDKMPRGYGTVNGVSVDYPDLDEIVRYWKERLGIR